ncbi:GNAT family N-acetyltransferase [Actinomyces bowdenii]|uniref:GNAT family N-acetyltransferase n=1 Tax=Actinomyces bowdenii TaxID=131109 RepID=A0A3P1V8K5_9ACTO|nr:GNAT family N-acetyltransferase [Actinomyces bowdenii]RRD29997.1 GNAT family N-acetyltransferase [Actinomyces bowdenii]
MTSTPDPQERPSVFDADPIAGLDARAGGLDGRGHDAHQHGGADGGRVPAGGFVRPARAQDLARIGAIHAVTMRASLEAAHDAAHGSPLPEGVRAMISAPVITAGWREAVASPPSPQHRVLVATQDGGVVGLLGMAPTRATDPDETTSAARAGGAENDGDGPTGAQQETAAEITALGVDPGHQLHGHGSRLLAAAVDLARQDGASALVAWSVRGDESLTRLLRAVGMAPTGVHRQLPVGQGVIEDCWAASL